MKIDFHGFSLEDAKTKFFETIDYCYYSNKRCILFITGKGAHKGEDENESPRLYRGKIRSHLLNWVNDRTVVTKILNAEQAGFSYGGDGAFFVYLRKNKY